MELLMESRDFKRFVMVGSALYRNLKKEFKDAFSSGVVQEGVQARKRPAKLEPAPALQEINVHNEWTLSLEDKNKNLGA